MGFGGSSAGDQAQANYVQQQQAIQQGLAQINKTFSGFTPQFFNQRAQDYVNYAAPQLGQQYQQQQKGLGYSLANQGLLNSSAGQDLSSQLSQQYKLGQQNIVNQGQQQAQALQQQVANTQGQLISQLTASANPSSVAGQAINAAANYSAPSTFAPIGNLFSQWGNIYAANSLGNAAGGGVGTTPYGAGYFAPGARGAASYNTPITQSGN